MCRRSASIPTSMARKWIARSPRYAFARTRDVAFRLPGSVHRKTANGQGGIPMKHHNLIAAIVTVLLLTVARGASAQLVAAKDGPIVYGHHHLSTANIDAQKKFLVDTLGGTAMKIGTNN